MKKTEAQLRATANYAAKNKERLKESNLKYRKANPEACLLRAARNRSLKYNLVCTITKEDVVIPEICPILGIKLERKFGTYGGHDASPSLDRIDPTLGYIQGNVWVISQKANAMKSNATNSELKLFANWVNKTYD